MQKIAGKQSRLPRFRSDVSRATVQVDSGNGSVERAHALGYESGNHARQHVTRSSGGHTGISGTVDVQHAFGMIADQGGYSF